MATYLDEYRNRKLSFAPLLQAGKMTLGDTMVYQELLYRIQVLETCQMLCKTAPVTTDPRALIGHYQLVDAVLFCAGKEHAFGALVQEQGKARRKAAGENLAKIVADCRKRFSSFQAKSPEQYRQSISAMVGTVLVAWVQLRNTYVPIGEEAKAEMSKEEQYQKLCEINRVEGFDPAAFAVEYTDMNTGEVRKRLPVMIQMAWFRLKYPEGRIAVEVVPAKDCFVAKARVYPNYQDGPECYLAEATASRGSDPDHPSVSPREWAQTAAVGVALRNAGFGLQFGAAGEDYSQSSPEELTTETPTSKPEEPAYEAEEPSPEEQLRQAMNTPCPIAKYKGKTLGDVLTLDPRAISWVANKFTGNSQISEAAKLLCDYALEQTAS